MEKTKLRISLSTIIFLCAVIIMMFSSYYSGISEDPESKKRTKIGAVSLAIAAGAIIAVYLITYRRLDKKSFSIPIGFLQV